ncbi:MAG TPA: hypothetical protein EYP77_07235 [Anaerolineae bacterium]|nr:hypothetical protein [Anaerolineae bacterium]
MSSFKFNFNLPGGGKDSAVTRITVRARHSRAVPGGWDTVDVEVSAVVKNPSRWEAEALRIGEELKLLLRSGLLPPSVGNGEHPPAPMNGRREAIHAFWRLVYGVDEAGRRSPDALTQEEGLEILEAAGGDFTRARRLLEGLLEKTGGDYREALALLRRKKGSTA